MVPALASPPPYEFGVTAGIATTRKDGLVLADALHAVMCGAGHNLRMVLAALRLYCVQFGLSMRAGIGTLLVASSDRKPTCG